MSDPTISAAVRERIVDAANTLYAQSDQTAFPSVSAVRRAAGVEMNVTSSVMKDWRLAQTEQAQPAVVAVPQTVQQAGDAAIATLWSYAQEATEALRNAQNAWDAERAELDVLRQEMAEAFEAQAGELDAAQTALEQLRTELAEAQAGLARDAEAARRVRSAHQGIAAELENAAARTVELEGHVSDLRAELQRAHTETEQTRAERDAARQRAGEARETAAKLAGQLEATQTHSVALLSVLQEVGVGARH